MSSKFKVGIMSTAWEVEAPNEDIAVMALRIWGEYPTIPIAVYSTNTQSKYMNLLNADDDEVAEVHRFCERNKPEIKKAIKSIKEL